MAEVLKVQKVGDSLGVLLPDSVAEQLSIGEGDEFLVTQTPDGLHLTPFDPDFSATVDDARAFMRSHRDAFRDLAK